MFAKIIGRLNVLLMLWLAWLHIVELVYSLQPHSMMVTCLWTLLVETVMCKSALLNEHNSPASCRLHACILLSFGTWSETVAPKLCTFENLIPQYLYMGTDLVFLVFFFRTRLGPYLYNANGIAVCHWWEQQSTYLEAITVWLDLSLVPGFPLIFLRADVCTIETTHDSAQWLLYQSYVEGMHNHQRWLASPTH